MINLIKNFRNLKENILMIEEIEDNYHGIGKEGIDLIKGEIKKVGIGLGKDN